MVGVGVTQELSLRVSVATLVRVAFTNPHDGSLTLALERKGALHPSEKPMKLVQEVYLAMPPNERNAPVLFEKNRLDKTMAAVLEGIMQPKHQSLS